MGPGSAVVPEWLERPALLFLTPGKHLHRIAGKEAWAIANNNSPPPIPTAAAMPVLSILCSLHPGYDNQQSHSLVQLRS